MNVFLVDSNLKTREEAAVAPTSNSHCDRFLPQILSQEFVLRDGAVHSHSSVLLCRSKSRGIPGAYQERRNRGSIIIQ